MGLLIKYYSSDQVKEGEVRVPCGTCGGGEEMHAGFWCRNLQETDHLEGICVYRRIILICLFWLGFVWLVQDKDK